MKSFSVLVMMSALLFMQAGFSAGQVLSPKELVAAKKAELNETQWTIELTPMEGKGRAEMDTISFSEGKIFSENLHKSGYTATDFTVRVEEDETVIWETMQTDTKDNFAFWRGDIKDGVMRGVLSMRNNRGKTTDFSFVSK